MVANHLVQQQQFATPIQNAKFVTNSANNHTIAHTVNHSTNHTINHGINQQTNHTINHTVNNQSANLMKQSQSTISGSSADHSGQLITVSRLNELVRELDPTVQLDEEVEDTLLSITDDFVENVINGACLMAKHRHVPTVEVKDVQLYLERSFNMWIPGFGTDELRPYKRASLTEAHKQRLALIRRALKKY